MTVCAVLAVVGSVTSGFPETAQQSSLVKSILLNQMNPGAGNGMQNIFALNGLAGGNTGLGGLGGLGIFGGGGLNGGIYGGGAWGGSSIQPNEMCAPVNVAKAMVNK